MRLAWMIVLLDEAGPDEFDLDEVGWMSLTWMICPVSVCEVERITSSPKFSTRL